MRFFFSSFFIGVLFCNSALADCYVVLAYKTGTRGPSTGPGSFYSECTANFEQNNFSCSGPDQYPAGAQWVDWDARIYRYSDQYHDWYGQTQISKSFIAGGQIQHDAMCDSPNFNACIAAKYPSGCPVANPCEAKRGQRGAAIYVGMPHDSQYYDTVGVCDDGCTVKPARGVTANSYASDGSGYVIGPWTYTGDQCQEGTETPPPQPSPADQDDAGKNACAAKCAGRAYQYDPATGGCECFGAPSYTTDPPLDPTVPTADPGSPPVPGVQTPTTDPGGDAQLGAQISNQGKQLAQGDAQLGQLGAINNKLGAVISNQGKQIGQGDKILDYQRRQLGALEEIRNELKSEDQGDNPGLPDSFELDTSIGDAKNWTEHDDPNQVAHNQATADTQGIPPAPQLPMDIALQVSGSPVLSGVMFGRTVEIRFDRPWMETGYAIMAAMLIGIGYLQVFFMVNRTLTNNR